MRIERAVAAANRYGRIVGAGADRLFARARRDRHRLLAAAIVIGILFMVIHWG